MEKRPSESAWQRSNPAMKVVVRGAIRSKHNVGGLNNQGKADVDFDDREAVLFADQFLPDTSIYGRLSNPSSHRRYRTDEVLKATKYRTGRGHIELRVGNSQTLMPGSVHPSGELYKWENDQSPKYMSGFELDRAIRFIAVATLLYRYWQEGQRDELATAVCGAMLRGGFSVRETDRLIRVVSSVAGDEETLRRVKAGRLKKALKARHPVPGIPRLKEILGHDASIFLGCMSIDAPDNSGDLVYTRLDTVERRPIQWMWEPWLALRKLTIMSGNPGTGKSSVALDIAARVTTASRWPGGTPCTTSGNVILIAGEDDMDDTIGPRFDLAGGDSSRLYVIQSGISLKEGIVDLENLVQEIGDVRLIIIDPLSEFIGVMRSQGDPIEARQTLTPFRTLCQKYEIAGLVINHLNKDSNQDPVLRSAGSHAFVALPRASIMMAKDPMDHSRRLMVPGKINLGCDDRGFAYRIVEDSPQQGIKATRIDWEEKPVTDWTLDDIFRQSRRKASPKKDQAEQWLRDILSDGPIPRNRLQELAKQAGMAWPTVDKAARVLGLKRSREGFGPGSHVTWHLRDA
jgi:hypothetical protein